MSFAKQRKKELIVEYFILLFKERDLEDGIRKMFSEIFLKGTKILNHNDTDIGLRQ